MRREAILALSRKKIIPPFTLEESLTFYCPQENLEAFDNPTVADFHKFMSSRYVPPVGAGPTIMLVLPCTKQKPYVMSPEHRAINTHVLDLGFEPASTADIPQGLEAHLPEGTDPAVLNNGLLVRDGVQLHRFVISEPMGLVPYELLYRYRGEMSPASRYDDPGLFEHRPNTVCPWRDDCSAIRRGSQFRWGDNEKLAYVQVHNKLVDLVAAILSRIRGHYQNIVAYVSPGLTHRSFVTSSEEKKADGLRRARRIASRSHYLHGVNDVHPGMVTVVPTKAELGHIFKRLEKRLRAEQGTVPPAQVRGYFARGGGGATPLALPEALEVLEKYLIV